MPRLSQRSSDKSRGAGRPKRTAASKTTDVPQIFKGLSFYIPPVAGREKMQESILIHGGVMADGGRKKGFIKLATPSYKVGKNDPVTYDVKFISESIKNKRLLNKEDYIMERFESEYSTTSESDSNVPVR
eukprot:UC1_evm1s1701